uniref:Uncharacterized protein n=1 Tax=Arundo donax TaxID=35708 RepID=A0A0A9AGC3_ARUDO
MLFNFFIKKSIDAKRAKEACFAINNSCKRQKRLRRQ